MLKVNDSSWGRYRFTPSSGRDAVNRVPPAAKSSSDWTTASVSARVRRAKMAACGAVRTARLLPSFYRTVVFNQPAQDAAKSRRVSSCNGTRDTGQEDRTDGSHSENNLGDKLTWTK